MVIRDTIRCFYTCLFRAAALTVTVVLAYYFDFEVATSEFEVRITTSSSTRQHQNYFKFRQISAFCARFPNRNSRAHYN